MNRFVSLLERALFGHRALVLFASALLTLAMAYAASGLKISAGFEKMLPERHEYVETFEQYRNELFDANRVVIVVRARQGSIWTEANLKTLLQVSDAVTYLDGVNRGSVMSLWTPNVFYNEITEDGFLSEQLISGTITPDSLTPEVIEQIKHRVVVSGYSGLLVSKDEAGAVIVAELNEVDPRSGEPLDYIAFAHALDEKIRAPFENDQVEVQIIGFSKVVGDIADGASGVLLFCAIALVLTALAVYWYCRSWKLTLLPVVCSLLSLIWQFGSLRILGYGLDPLAVLVPFLVFAIGVSHGVQQINFIVRQLAAGDDSLAAAKASFSGLLIPGSLALATALISFGTMMLVPIPMIRELALTASIGVGYKIITNLILLPVAASYFRLPPGYAERALAQRERRSLWMKEVARVAKPRNAALMTVATLLLFVVAVLLSQGRHVGSLQPGASELRPDARYNLDSVSVAQSFDIGLDWLTVVVEAPADSCEDVELFRAFDQFGWEMSRVPGVVSVESAATLTKLYNAGFNEGQPKMAAIPRDGQSLGYTLHQLQQSRGIRNADCSVLALNLYLADHKATTIKGLVAAVKQYREAHPLPGVKIRLASGNAGIEAATNEVLEESELPMMLYVYAAILLLVFLAYRDWRAMIACCLPLTVATFIGYAFMKYNDIGLTIATLPVMVLAVGVGVDYAFYIYNRLQWHLAQGLDIVAAFEQALQETGVATVFTALTLSVGVATWSFSALKFQADMGKLLTFMFMVNMLMAITALPAFAVVLERLFPRTKPVRVPGLMHH
ncbi:RND family transporter [Stagnimonas aquatica]|uniref:RND family transporter n=1 Tax=Stagnimonas aquatica TaxID=2689987 RepID=A0A3N0VJV4_9GAMM|nr:efflux RND transporter permease subunit [Stagnimonas aquatica]ROH93043.1 RND family transporter [Stagnimonas aquatica]